MAIEDNLVSWWSLDEESGERADSHGSNDLTDTNTVLYGSGKQGNAASFVGANAESLEHVDVASLSFGNEDFTFAGWFYLDLHNIDRNLISKYDSAGDNREYRLYFDDSEDRITWRVTNAGASGGTVVQADQLGAVSVATWYFIVVWHDSTSNVIAIQVNDGTADTTAWSNGCNDNTSPFKIGGPTWDGLIDEVACWNRLLTASEKTELYNSGDGRVYDYWEATAQAVAGAISFVGTLWQTTFRDQDMDGTLALSGILVLQSLWKRTLEGLLQFSGIIDYYKRIPKAVAGTLDFAGTLLKKVTHVEWVQGTLTFSSTIVVRLKKFVTAIISLSLTPITIVRAWLDPSADVDLD